MRELCRNFQRGSCRYGEGCRFLHPQQTKPNNSSGFGTQQQQKSTNPFGFGVQDRSQGSQGAGSNRTNQFQPFENKWTRPGSTPSGGGSSAQQTGKQPQQTDHKCTDPAECKRIMQEDFKNERPMWKLTCYSHFKYMPCDITGDISYEELRAMSYEEAKRGTPLQSIVERERNLQSSKIAEFENFLRNPYRGSATPNQSPFPAATPSIFPPTAQINPPSAFSGFNQQNASPNINPGVSSSGPPNPFASFSQQSNAFRVNTPQPVPSGGFQMQPSTSGTSFISKPGAFGQGPGSGPTNTTPQSNSIFASINPTPTPNTSLNNQTTFNLNVPNTSQGNQTAFNLNIPAQSSSTHHLDTTKASSETKLETVTEASPVDTSIWLKEKWTPGEIPEQAPPDSFCIALNKNQLSLLNP